MLIKLDSLEKNKDGQRGKFTKKIKVGHTIYLTALSTIVKNTKHHKCINCCTYSYLMKYYFGNKEEKKY